MATPVREYGPNVPVSNIVIPREGPRALEVTLDFTTTARIDIEGLLAVTTGQISYIQGIYVDNADNPEPLTITAKTTQQRLIIPARAQGYWPILFASVPDCKVETTQAAVVVYLHFYNVPIQSDYWLTNDASPVSANPLTNTELRASPIAVIAEGTEYETVAASATDQILGATGAVGDLLSGLLIVPASTSPGAVSIKDGNGSAITVFTGGASSVSNLVPFFVPINAKCVNATTPGWKVTTGTGVSAFGVGNFT